MRTKFDRAPVIETDRLKLRPFAETDFDAFAALWADPEVVKHISGVTASRTESWGKILTYSGAWPLIGYGYWAVEEKASGRFVGLAGFMEFLREIEPSIEGRPETAWVMAPWAQGQGYATEAMQAGLDWGREHLNGRRPVCIMDADYVATRRVAEKCGFVKLDETEFNGKRTLMMELP